MTIASYVAFSGMALVLAGRGLRGRVREAAVLAGCCAVIAAFCLDAGA